MSEPVLKYTVIVRRPDTNVATPLLAGKPVPDWATDLVHDDDLVVAGDHGEKKAPAKKAAASSAAK